MASEDTAAQSAIITQVSGTRAEMKHAMAQSKAGNMKGTSAKKGSMEDLVEHTWEASAVAKFFKTDMEKGLTSAEVDAKVAEFGLNQLTPPKTKPMICLFFEHLTGFFSLLLWLAAVLCFIAYGLDGTQPENLYLGIVLATVTVLTGIFSFYQDYQSASVMAGFRGMLPPQTEVYRNGDLIEIAARDLVPGDICKVTLGKKIPADMYVIKSANFKVDNASLTGESLPVKRKLGQMEEGSAPLEASNLAFFGTKCVEGNATCIVIRTADNTVIGNISKLASSTSNVKTPIAIEIEHFIHIVSSVAVFLGVLFLIIGVVKGTYYVQNMVFCIGIIVANVPEGLLATVTVALTLTAKRMAAKSVLVKNLEAVETLGSTNTIASDKTGTLTMNRMTVQHCWYDLQTWDATVDQTSKKYDPLPEEAKKNTDVGTFAKLLQVACLCNNTTFEKSLSNMARNVMDRKCQGDASETALVKFVEPIHPIEDMRGANTRVEGGEISFTSANKFHVTIHNNKNDANLPRMVLMKGAPERVFNRCTHIIINGEIQEITDEITATYEADLRKMMCDGERVLGFSCLDLPQDEFPVGFEYECGGPDYNFPLSGMIFCGLISVIDPPRPTVRYAVNKCRTAGIKVMMVTGDHPDTAEAIAKDVGIISGMTHGMLAAKLGKDISEVDPQHKDITAKVIKGSDLEKMSNEELDSSLDYSELVFARTSPEQKLIIVKGLQKKTILRRPALKDDHATFQPRPVKHIVAVTGDGVNDSPAIKKADIGIAMGIAGTEVAKDAADMILLDDDFASIVAGVEEGRKIFDNLKKSIAYTLSSNIPEISPFLVYILANVPLPLPTVLILCIDLGTDMVPAISLAYEDAEANIMLKNPRDSRVDRLVTSKLVNFSYLQVGVIQATAGFFAYIIVLMDYGFAPSILPNLATTWEAYKFVNTSGTNSEFGVYSMWSDSADGTSGSGSLPDAVRVLNYSSKIYPHRGEYGEICGTDRDPKSQTITALGAIDEANCRPLRQCTYGWTERQEIASIISADPTDENLLCQSLGNVYCNSPLPVSQKNPCHNPVEALAHAQTAFFISIIVVQWADLTACKTRTLSIKQQGMWNRFLNFGLFFETALGAILCYIVQLNGPLGTRPIRFEHWLCAMPFSALILSYDEVRKWMLRQDPHEANWVYKNTYY